ncbi:MAG TPA: tRNA pseudouridine(38-40) synthase TruA [Candidatus Binatia bacterium]|nr:tRNA pseudouridine(38-40) synthase TruA [Candidatus Binatia bacterium]
MRLRAIVAYDGTAYQGWQSQRGRAPTLQEEIERALSVALREPIRIRAAGRTDTGVHALGQVIAFDVSGDPYPADAAADASGASSLDALLRSVNALLPPDVAVRSLAGARAEFDPRRDAVRRAYRYRIWNAPVRSPFEGRIAWHVREPLDVRAMQSAAAAVVGEHDFASFQGADHVARASIRHVFASGVERAGDVVTYRVEANAFARHMVRNLVGELVEIGRGRRGPESIAALLAARDRRLAAAPAPPHGLVLEWVRYPEGG